MATKIRVACDNCPFVHEYSSQAKADYHFSRHSCDRQNRLAANHARHQARRAAVDKAPKPCHHKQTTHVHGTRTCYVLDKCRCDPCSAAHSAYEKNRVRQQAYGRWNGLVDAQPAREHVESLMAQGMGLKRIVAVGNVSQGALWKLIYGKRRPDGTRVPSKRIIPDLERRILAIRLDLADGARVDSTGAVRRIRALVALGYSMSKIATRLGMTVANFSDLPQGRRAQISVAHDRAIRALYDEWSMHLPPQEAWHDKAAASRARNYAQARGWLPPLALDDDQLDATGDMPTAEPAEADDYLDEAAIERRMAGDKTVRLTDAERVELVRLMRAKEFNLAEIERRTGLNPRRYLQTPKGVSA